MLKPIRPILLICALVVAPVALSACGDDHDADDSAITGRSPGVDLAFAEAMIPHHQSAIEMANIALRNGTRAFVKKLARDIQATQQEEIDTLASIRKDLTGAGVRAHD